MQIMCKLKIKKLLYFYKSLIFSVTSARFKPVSNILVFIVVKRCQRIGGSYLTTIKVNLV